MHRLAQRLSLPFALVALASLARAEDATANLTAGMTSAQVAGAIEGAWSLSANFGCSSNANKLTVVATPASPCSGKQRVFTFNVDGGTLSENHTFTLRVTCNSLSDASRSGGGFTINASGSIDGGPFLPIGPGGTAFNAGSDSISISAKSPNPFPGGVPAQPWPVLVALALLLLGVGLSGDGQPHGA